MLGRKLRRRITAILFCILLAANSTLMSTDATAAVTVNAAAGSSQDDTDHSTAMQSADGDSYDEQDEDELEALKLKKKTVDDAGDEDGDADAEDDDQNKLGGDNAADKAVSTGSHDNGASGITGTENKSGTDSKGDKQESASDKASVNEDGINGGHGKSDGDSGSKDIGTDTSGNNSDKDRSDSTAADVKDTGSNAGKDKTDADGNVDKVDGADVNDAGSDANKDKTDGADIDSTDTDGKSDKDKAGDADIYGKSDNDKADGAGTEETGKVSDGIEDMEEEELEKAAAHEAKDMNLAVSVQALPVGPVSDYFEWTKATEFVYDGKSLLEKFDKDDVIRQTKDYGDGDNVGFKVTGFIIYKNERNNGWKELEDPKDAKDAGKYRVVVNFNIDNDSTPYCIEQDITISKAQLDGSWFKFDSSYSSVDRSKLEIEDGKVKGFVYGFETEDLAKLVQRTQWANEITGYGKLSVELYTTSALTEEQKMSDSKHYDAKINNDNSDYGMYSVAISCAGGENVEASGPVLVGGGNVSYYCYIYRADNSVTSLRCDDIYYGATPSPQATATDSSGGIEYTYSKEIDGNYTKWDAKNFTAGTYYVKAQAKAGFNYNESQWSQPVAFNVKRIPGYPTLKSLNSKVYDGTTDADGEIRFTTNGIEIPDRDSENGSVVGKVNTALKGKLQWTSAAAGTQTVICNNITIDPSEKDWFEARYILTKTSIDKTTGKTTYGLDAEIEPAYLSGFGVSQQGVLTYNGTTQTADVAAKAATVDGSAVRFAYALSWEDRDNGNTQDTVPALTDAGEHMVYIRASAANHYYVDSSFMVTIEPADLIIKADDISITEGDEPKYTVSYDGLLGSDSAGDLSGTLKFDCDYTAESGVGEYTITPSGLSSKNYNITFVPGKLTVKAKPQDNSGNSGRGSSGSSDSGSGVSGDRSPLTGSGGGSWQQEPGGNRWRYSLPGGGYVSGSLIVDASGSKIEYIKWAEIDGRWWAFGADSYTKSGWVMDNSSGLWYYIDGQTGMKNSWINDGSGFSYYLDPISGAMLTGWRMINGRWYYFSTERAGSYPYGAMLKNSITPDGYRVGADGSRIA